MRGHPSGYKIPLTDRQKLLAETLLEELGRGVAEKISDALHSLLWDLLLPQRTSFDWQSPFWCYFALLSLRDDNGYQIPDVITGWLAKFKYLCRNAAIYEASKNIAKFENGIVG
jgi:hypothetical protein